MTIILKQDAGPVWLGSLPSPPASPTLLLLGGNGQQVAVPAPLILAVSPLVRSIFIDLLPPAFAPCILSLPDVTSKVLHVVVDILDTGELVGEHEDDIEEVRKVFKMLGVEASLVSYHLDSIQVVVDQVLDTVENASDGKDFSLNEGNMFEIFVKIENKEEKIEDTEVGNLQDGLNKLTPSATEQCDQSESIQERKSINVTNSDSESVIVSLESFLYNRLFNNKYKDDQNKLKRRLDDDGSANQASVWDVSPRKSARLQVWDMETKEYKEYKMNKLAEEQSYFDDKDNQNQKVRGKRRNTSHRGEKDPNKGFLMPEDITPSSLKKVGTSWSSKVFDQDFGTTCHQCRRKTVDTKTICRSGECMGVRGQFCGRCLEIRYGEDAKKALMDPHWNPGSVLHAETSATVRSVATRLDKEPLEYEC